MPVARTLSPSSVRAARDLRVAVSRLRRRLVDVADTHELTPSQLSVLSRLGKEGPASASDLAAADGSGRSRSPRRWRFWRSARSSSGAPTPATADASWFR